MDAAICFALSTENTGDFYTALPFNEMLSIAQRATRKGRLWGKQISGPSISARLEFTKQYI